MATPHKHAAIIKAWADGAEIEVQYNPDGQWCTVFTPKWKLDSNYRIKPERVFPKTTLTVTQLVESYFGDLYPTRENKDVSVYYQTANTSMRRIADAAIKQYILDTEKQ